MQTETEVDFIYLAKTIWKRKLLVIKLTGIAAVAGFLISIMIPNRYTASTTLVQEILDPKITLNEARLSAISALAAVAGVNINELSNAKMRPPTFSTVISSVPFRRELMNTLLNFGQSDTAQTFYDYYSKTVEGNSFIGFFTSLPDRIVNSLKRGEIEQISQTKAPVLPQLTRKELEVNKILSNQITLQLQEDEYITISCTLPEAFAAAQLTKRTEELLRSYLTEVQTEKPRANLQFIQERYNEAKKNFLAIQEALIALQSGETSAKISNLNSFNTVKSEEIRLTASSRIAENVYSELARKLEQSKIALNEQTPVFKIVNPVTVPTSQSYPNRAKLTTIFSFFGFVLVLILIIGRGFIEETKEKWRK